VALALAEGAGEANWIVPVRAARAEFRGYPASSGRRQLRLGPVMPKGLIMSTRGQSDPWKATICGQVPASLCIMLRIDRGCPGDHRGPRCWINGASPDTARRRRLRGGRRM